MSTLRVTSRTARPAPGHVEGEDEPARLLPSPVLDGVRAVAVLMVFACHTTGHAVLGYAGVDLFFVLSGFLITRVLLHEQLLSGRLRLRRFYRNRVLRLYPALLLFLVLAPVPALLVGESWSLLGVRTVQGALYLQDLVGAGLLGPAADPDVHQHLWSLAVEEQFYVVWPFVLLALARASRGRRVGALAALVVLGEVLRIVVGARTGFYGNYFFLTGHLDALLLGALGAVVVLQSPPALWDVPTRLAVLLAASLMATAWALPVHQAWRLDTGVGFAVDVAALGVVLHLVAHPGHVLARVLSVAPLTWLGRRSYGFYLFHLLVLRTLDGLGAPAGARVLLGLPLTLLLVEWSWRRVELPCLAHKR